MLTKPNTKRAGNQTTKFMEVAPWMTPPGELSLPEPRALACGLYFGSCAEAAHLAPHIHIEPPSSYSLTFWLMRDRSILRRPVDLRVLKSRVQEKGDEHAAMAT
jgi:hypothetical protein